MDREMFEQAKKLAERPYQMMTFLDKTTDGEPVFVALIPELPGCASHGDNIDEARDSLDEAKVEFIYFMLRDGLAVPEPKLLATQQRINVSDYMDNIMHRGVQTAVPRGKILAPLASS